MADTYSDTVPDDDATAYRVERPTRTVRLPHAHQAPIGQDVLFPEIEQAARDASPLLSDRFLVPPFSVLDTRQGAWQKRKAEWLSLGIQSELGRGADGSGANNFTSLNDTPDNLARYGRKPGAHDGYRAAADLRSNLTGASPVPEYADVGMVNMAPGTSIFDPVLCEAVYTWWMPRGGTVLDPFAGGSVRGITAAMTGHPYTGFDLSRPQVEANREQADFIVGPDFPAPSWEVGDSAKALPLLTQQYDLVFTCPPYYDLEVYSDDPADLSAAPTYMAFLSMYAEIIRLAAQRLRDGRFMVIVVGEVRDKKGWCYGLVPDTIRLVREQGLHLYNDAVLYTPVGTLQLRVPRQFVAGRKLGRTHQSVLAFYKGDTSPKWGEG